MASFLSTAASYLGRTTLASNYTVDPSSPALQCGNWRITRAVRNSSSSTLSSAASSSSSGAAGPSGGPGSQAMVNNPSADLGAGKGVVSIWEAKLEARGSARQLVVEMLKKEASTLTRLRHPCILSVVEPVEETRGALTFATEPVVASLHHAVLASESAGRASAEVALDEVEIQKGLLQVARGLEFLHQAGMVHGNLDSNAIVINAKGDWKLCSFGFLTPLKQPDGTITPYRHPDYDPTLPPSLSVNFDYLAPEYALDEKREPANDMYSLGCIVFAVHSKGNPPFRNRNSLTNLRSNVDGLSTAAESADWRRLGKDVVELLSSLLTRFPGSRYTAVSFQKAGYFNNILVSTLKFLERESFSGRTKEERVQFLKGLLGVLPQFSDRLLRRKVLPALLELMADRSLLPFILPNVFHIAKTLSSIEFSSSVLPRLQPLFTVQDPPQTQLMLLDQIELFVSKTSPPVFREGVTPLLYSSLETEQAQVQERALQKVPRLCEVLEYSHVKEVLFPKIAVLFSKTKILSVKVNTLISFHHMIPILDKHTLTEKLVPLLSRIKTREPSVMIATLAVHESLASKVDRETLAIHIIPQLWIMSMGPLLSADQFEKFIRAAREMGEKVAKEHLAHLKEMKRMQEHSESYAGNGPNDALGGAAAGGSSSGDVDFATLVGSGKDSGTGVVARDVGRVPTSNGSSSASGNGMASFDPFAFDDLPPASSSPMSSTPAALTPAHTGSATGPITPAPYLRPGPRPSAGSASNSFMSSSSSASLPTLAAPPLGGAKPSTGLTPATRSAGLSTPMLAPNRSAATPPPGWTSGGTLVPSSSSAASRSNLGASAPITASASASASTSPGLGPNYNISLPPASNFGQLSSTNNGSTGGGSTSLTMNGGGLPPLLPQTSSLNITSPPAQAQAQTSLYTPAPQQQQQQQGPPGWGGSVLQPSKPANKAGGAAGNSQGQWGEFDPFA